ncbi:MAG: hypothetical protein ACR2NQ_00110, partial [Thermodesulfobacteriota bacterium]
MGELLEVSKSIRSLPKADDKLFENMGSLKKIEELPKKIEGFPLISSKITDLLDPPSVVVREYNVHDSFAPKEPVRKSGTRKPSQETRSIWSRIPVLAWFVNRRIEEKKRQEKEIELKRREGERKKQAESYLKKGDERLNSRSYDGAMEFYKKAKELTNGVNVAAKQAKTYNSWGIEKHSNKDYEGAIECFNNAMKIDPDYEEWLWSYTEYVERGGCYRTRRRKRKSPRSDYPYYKNLRLSEDALKKQEKKKQKQEKTE